MNHMTAYCGLNCGECPAYLATIGDDDEKRKEVAVLWSKIYRSDVKPEDVNCHGCVSGSDVLFNHCRVFMSCSV